MDDSLTINSNRLKKSLKKGDKMLDLFTIRIPDLLKKSIPAWAVVFVLLLGYNEIRHINKTLNNHISSTNKKIDVLSADQKAGFDKVDKRIDDLYKILLNQKEDK